MFKLGGAEDIDFEEDFLQGAFPVPKRHNVHVASPIPSCSKSINNKSFVTTPTHYKERELPLQRVLTTRTDNVQSRPSCSSYTSIKGTESFRNEYRTAVSEMNNAGLCSETKKNKKSDAECENWLDDGSDDIDWDMCFEDCANGQEDVNFSDSTCEKGRVSNLNVLPNRPTPDLSHNTSFDSSVRKVSTCTTRNVLSHKHESLQSISRTCRKRKFPGPAGILPTQMTSPLPTHLSLVDLIATTNYKTVSPKLKQLNDDLMLSQLTQNPFESEPWIQMQQDLDLDSDNADIVTKYNISWVLLKAANKQLPCGKVPVLILVVKTVLEKGEEASVVFKDQTGEMPGSIHRKVFEEYEDCLVPGAVLVVRKVSVFSPTPRKHYLNVTPANVVCLYSPNSKRPRILGDGITRPRLQLREYALESWISQIPPPVNSYPRCQTGAHVQVKPNPVRLPGGQSSITPLTSVRVDQQSCAGPGSLSSSDQRVNASRETTDEDMVFADDDLDLLFADLDNDLC